MPPFHITQANLATRERNNAHPKLARWYTDYLNSKAWKRLRHTIFTTRKNRCEVCKTEDELMLHHLTYERVGKEKRQDVQILCVNCHSAIPHRRIPYIDRIYDETFKPTEVKWQES